MIDRETWSFAGVAQTIAVTAYSNQYSTTYSADKTIDGSTSTYWRTNTPAGAYVVVELGGSVPVSSMSIYVGNTTYRAKTFTIAGSNDGVNFTDLFTGELAATSGWQTFTWANTVAYKYVRFTCNTGNSGRLYVNELQFGYGMTLAYTKAYGKYVVAVFDSDVSAPETEDKDHFTIRAEKADYSTGSLQMIEVQRTVQSVERHPDGDNMLLIRLAADSRLDECLENAWISYDGSGSLSGNGRPVMAFEHQFSIEETAYKGDQNPVEHIEIEGVDATGQLIRVYYRDAKSTDEHIEIMSVTAVGVLTHVDDI